MITGLGAPATPNLGMPTELGPASRTEAPSAADKAKAKAEQSAKAQKAMLEEIRTKGIYQWAQEQKLEKLKEKIRQQVMAERGMDDAALSKLPAEQRATAESEIEAEIARRLQEAMKDAMEGEAKKAKDEGRPPAPMIIDISV